MKRLLVVTVTKDVEKYPEFAEDTLKNPSLVGYIEDEVESFVVDPEGGFWTAAEFFDCTNVSSFYVEGSL